MTHLLGIGHLNQFLFFVTLYLLHINDFNGLLRNTYICWKILPNNLHIKNQMITDLKIFVNFYVWSVVTICKIGREFDWIKCKKKEKSDIWWWKKFVFGTLILPIFVFEA